MKNTIFYFLFGCLILALSACDNGSTSANSSGLSCKSIAGLKGIYGTNRSTGQTVYHSHAGIGNDCSIRMENKYGMADGTIVSKNGNEYLVKATDNKGKNISMTLADLGNDKFFITDLAYLYSL